MKQLILGAALVGTRHHHWRIYPQTPPTAQPTLSSLHPAVNQAMHCGTYQGSVNKGGSYTPTTDEYVRVTWTR